MFIVDQVMRGNTKFAFYCENYGKPELQSILSPVCLSVRPICCLWTHSAAPNAQPTPHSLDSLCTSCLLDSSSVAAHAAYLEAAGQLEERIAKSNKERSFVKSWQNSFSTMLAEIIAQVRADEFSADGVANEYALNRIQMQSIINDANMWFKKANETNTSGEDYREMCEKYRNMFNQEMNEFHEKRVKQLEIERKRKEEEDKLAEIEMENKRIAQEEERRAQQKAMVLHWSEINKNTYYLSSYISQSDIDFWLSNHNRVYFFLLRSSHR